MNSISPTPETIKALAESPDQGPVVMLNLLKFKKDGGAAAYAEYGASVTRMLQAIGGRIVFAGRVDQVVVGEQTWDVIALVEYPSRRAFLKMVTDPEYLKIHAHRERGLERTEL